MLLRGGAIRVALLHGAAVLATSPCASPVPPRALWAVLASYAVPTCMPSTRLCHAVLGHSSSASLPHLLRHLSASFPHPSRIFPASFPHLSRIFPASFPHLFRMFDRPYLSLLTVLCHGRARLAHKCTYLAPLRSRESECDVCVLARACAEAHWAVVCCC